MRSIHFIFFTSITYTIHFSIKLPNGDRAKVTHIGTVKLTLLGSKCLEQLANREHKLV